MDLKDNSKAKKSILNTLLLKRSTKVEPHPSSSYDEKSDDDDANNSSFDDQPCRPFALHDQQQNPFQTSVSANSTPIKRLHKIGRLNRLWHCHSSNQSLTSNHSAPSYFLRKISASTKQKIRNKNDRHSHPISHSNVIPDDSNAYDAFYAVNDYIDADHIEHTGHIVSKNPSNKNSVQFYANGGLHVPRSISSDRFSATSSAGMVTSKSQEQIIVNDIDESVICDSSKQQSPTSRSHDGNFGYNRDQDESDFPAGHSIAMSACRSRLRERLLPPGYVNRSQPSPNEQQHYSFPNIIETSPNPSTAEHRNSRSISCDLLSNGKRTGKTESLAKNSLMAAQLINLIPTEVARERYTNDISCI